MIFARLEIQLEADGQSSLAREFVIECQRVQAVVSISQIEQADSHLGPPLQEAITEVEIVLPEIIARNIGRITAIGLLGPDSIKLPKESATMLVDSKKPDLMESRRDVLVQCGGAEDRR